MPDIFVAKSKSKKSDKTTEKIQKDTTPPESIVNLEPQEPEIGETVKSDLSNALDSQVSIEKLHGHNHNPLTSFCYFPHNIDFINKEPDEKVVLLVRRHVLTNVPWLLVVLVMVAGPIILTYFPILNFLPLRFQTAAVLLWYLLTLAIFIQGFLSWFFSVNIVTNKRVIDADFENLIYRKISDAEITHIEDVTVQMGSVIRTLFNYGDVLIQTAAEVDQVEFRAVPHPDKIEKILSDLRMEVE